MKVIVIVGARPQFIKAAVVSRAMAQYNEGQPENRRFEEVIVHTGQHYDANMSEIFFSEMRIPSPKYNLHIGNASHGAMTGRMTEKIEEILLLEKPDVLMVYGDTNSTLAGALAASKLGIPVAHVEAGLRSYDMRMPEEINRVLTDRISRWLFCPTLHAMKNLKREGYEKISNAVLENVGDVMYDASMFYRMISRASITIGKKICEGDFYLATVHRQENTEDDEKLSSIMRALDDIGQKKKVILPLHPRTKKALTKLPMTIRNITFIDPVSYFDMIALLQNSLGVFTDSGGVQKEAYFFHKMCVTLRDRTEWMELVEHGFNNLAGCDYEKILAMEKCMTDKKADFSTRLYGDGHAGDKIIEKLMGCFCNADG